MYKIKKRKERKENEATRGKGGHNKNLSRARAPGTREEHGRSPGRDAPRRMAARRAEAATGGRRWRAMPWRSSPRALSLSWTPAARSHHSWLAPPHPEKMRTKEGKLDAEEGREGGRVGARKRWARVGVAKMAAFCSSPGLCLCLWGDCSCSVVNGIFASLRWGLELEVAKEWDLAFLVPRQGQRSGGIVVVRAVSACVLPKLPRRREPEPHS